MNISKYATYFHDGTISDVSKKSEDAVFTMRSATLEKDENKDNVPLGRYGAIRGKLYLIKIFDFKINNEHVSLNKLIYKQGEILHLKFYKNQIFLDVIWFSDDGSDIYQELSFSVKDYFFENIPSLVFPGDEDFDGEGRYIGPRIGF